MNSDEYFELKEMIREMEAKLRELEWRVECKLAELTERIDLVDRHEE